jgi:hypothetical protein
MTLMSFAALHPLARAASDAARIDAGAKLAVAPNAWVFASFDDCCPGAVLPPPP